ncbi:MAG: hypothetical protein ACSLFI_05915, partial [Solirubrobacterales bacterium]
MFDQNLSRRLVDQLATTPIGFESRGPSGSVDDGSSNLGADATPAAYREGMSAMSAGHVRPAAGPSAAVAAIALVAVLCACGASDGGAEGPTTTGAEGAGMIGASAVGLEPLAVLSEVVTGRLPDVAVGPGGMVAFAGTDFGLGNDDTDLAVSTNEGQSFSRLEFKPLLANIGVVVGDQDLLVVGTPCSEPDGLDPDATCAPVEPVMAAYVVDLVSGDARELPQPPVAGFVTDSVGEVDDGRAVIVSADAGPTLMVWSDEGWSSRILPSGTAQVCTSGGALTAVTNGQPLTG